MKFKYLIIVGLLLHNWSNFATVYYVKADATGTQNGLSWDNAFTDLQSALSIAVYGDEIWVAYGQYKTTQTTDRDISFVLKDGVNLYGSFSGVETTVNQRDLSNLTTVLNGDIGQTGDDNDNTKHILSGSNITSNIIIDGFKIINAKGDYEGGGLFYKLSNSGHLSLKNCYFYNDKSIYRGGAVYISKSHVSIENCTFVGNRTTSGGDGGAVYNDRNSTIEIIDSKFIGNYSRRGAAVYSLGTVQSLTIDRCVFTNNTSPYCIIFLFSALF